MKLNRIAITGVASVMGLGLIGVGAHAAFTTSTQSKQTVSTGTLVVKVVKPTPGTFSNTTRTVTLPALTNQGSSFVASTKVTVKNEGTLTAKERGITVTATTGGSTAAASTALRTQMWACLTVITTSGTLIAFNEPLSTAISYGTISILGTLAPNATTQYTLTLYAGSTDAGCGAAYTDIGPYPGFGPDALLPFSATNTPHYRGTKNNTKNTATPPASGLNNAAEGGTVQAALTFNYTA